MWSAIVQTPKRHFLVWLHVIWAIVRENLPTDHFSRQVWEKINRNKKIRPYTSHICPDASLWSIVMSSVHFGRKPNRRRVCGSLNRTRQNHYGSEPNRTGTGQNLTLNIIKIIIIFILKRGPFQIFIYWYLKILILLIHLVYVVFSVYILLAYLYAKLFAVFVYGSWICIFFMNIFGNRSIRTRQNYPQEMNRRKIEIKL